MEARYAKTEEVVKAKAAKKAAAEAAKVEEQVKKTAAKFAAAQVAKATKEGGLSK